MKGVALQRVKFYLTIGICFVLAGLLADSQSIINFFKTTMHPMYSSSQVEMQTVTNGKQ